MHAVRAHLIRRDARVVLLLTPPFDRTPHDPGYIKGYVRGVRENGGQYTHAAIWVVIALARLGMGDEASAIPVLRDGGEHEIRVVLGAREQSHHSTADSAARVEQVSRTT
jgi:hypothetical protein